MKQLIFTLPPIEYQIKYSTMPFKWQPFRIFSSFCLGDIDVQNLAVISPAVPVL